MLLSLVFGMLRFLYILLCFIQLQAKAGNTPCQMMGEPKYPLLFKDGDVTIGALFPVHSIETLTSFKFTQKPQFLSCSRSVIILSEMYYMIIIYFKIVFICMHLVAGLMCSQC